MPKGVSFVALPCVQEGVAYGLASGLAVQSDILRFRTELVLDAAETGFEILMTVDTGAGWIRVLVGKVKMVEEEEEEGAEEDRVAVALEEAAPARSAPGERNAPGRRISRQHGQKGR